MPRRCQAGSTRSVDLADARLAGLGAERGDPDRRCRRPRRTTRSSAAYVGRRQREVDPPARRRQRAIGVEPGQDVADQVGQRGPAGVLGRR